MALTLTINETGFHFSGRSVQPTKDKNDLLSPHNKMLHQYGIVLELMPLEKQETLLSKTIGCARVVHNDYLDKRIALYTEEKRTLSVADYKKNILPALKKEKPYLSGIDKFALEAACEHVDTAYQNMFHHKSGFPNYASRRTPNGNRYTTKFTNDNIAVLLEDRAYVKLPKVGKVPFILPKDKSRVTDILPPGARITKATIQRKIDRWFVSLQIESVIDFVHPTMHLNVKDIFAGDAGIKEFLIYGGREVSDTEHVENPRFISIHEKRLRRMQKKLSRRYYDTASHTGSKNWEKARRLVAKEQWKIANQRKDFQHKLSRKIADQCIVFIKEDLNIRGMMKNHCLAKAIASLGWYGFFQKLDYKLKKKGGFVLSVDRFYASSQLCHCCGYKNPEVKNLRVREWICPACGVPHNRDENAKQNLWQEGVRMLKKQGYTIIGMEAVS